MMAYMYIVIGYIDTKRITYTLKVMELMLTTKKKIKIKAKKLLPTINFLDIKSLKNWCYMRKLVMNYGR
jgi:hypothetical protein